MVPGALAGAGALVAELLADAGVRGDRRRTPSSDDGPAGVHHLTSTLPMGAVRRRRRPRRRPRRTCTSSTRPCSRTCRGRARTCRRSCWRSAWPPGSPAAPWQHDRMGSNGSVHDAGDGCWAYVQRDGSWGWSNAGLIVGDGGSLLVDTLFDLPCTREMLDAFGSRTARRADRRRRQHARQRRPLLRQRARRRRRDHRLGGDGRGDGRGLAGDARRAVRGAGRGRRPVPQLLRRLPVRRHHADAADAHVRGPPHRRRRRPRRRADRGRPGAHQGRHDRPRARLADRVHRRHPVHQRHPDRVGRPAGELGRRVRPDARHGRRRRRARPRPADRQGRASPRSATTWRSSTPRRRPATTPGSTRSTRPRRSAPCSAPATTSTRGARPAASRSTWRPSTARSTRRTAAPTSSSSSGGWPRSTTCDASTTSRSSVTARPAWRSPRRPTRIGLDVVVVGAGRPWTATYGTWRDDVPDLPDDCFAHVLDGIAVHGHRRHEIARPYGILDNDALRAHLAAGIDVRVGAGRADQPRARVVTADGDVDARIVVDARGRVDDGGAAAQTAYGVVVAERPAGRARADGPAPGRRRVRRRRSATRCRSATAGSSRRPSSRPARRCRAESLAPRLAAARRDHAGRRAHRARHDPDRRPPARSARPGAALRRRGRLHPPGHRLLRRRLAARRAAGRRPRWRRPMRRRCGTPSGRGRCAGPGASTTTGWRCCCASTRTSWPRSSTRSSTCPSTSGRRTCASTRRRGEVSRTMTTLLRRLPRGLRRRLLVVPRPGAS